MTACLACNGTGIGKGGIRNAEKCVECDGSGFARPGAPRSLKGHKPSPELTKAEAAGSALAVPQNPWNTPLDGALRAEVKELRSEVEELRERHRALQASYDQLRRDVDALMARERKRK